MPRTLVRISRRRSSSGQRARVEITSARKTSGNTASRQRKKKRPTASHPGRGAAGTSAPVGWSSTFILAVQPQAGAKDRPEDLPDLQGREGGRRLLGQGLHDLLLPHGIIGAQTVAPLQPRDLDHHPAARLEEGEERAVQAVDLGAQPAELVFGGKRRRPGIPAFRHATLRCTRQAHGWLTQLRGGTEKIGRASCRGRGEEKG